MPTARALRSGAFLPEQPCCFLPRWSCGSQTLSALQVGSTGDCSRNTLNFLSLARSLIFFCNIFPPLFTGFVKAPRDASRNRKKKKTNSITIFVEGREMVSQPALLPPSPRKVLRAEAISLAGSAGEEEGDQGSRAAFPSGAELWCFRRREPRAFSQARLGLWQPLGSPRGRRRLAPLH